MRIIRFTAFFLIANLFIAADVCAQQKYALVIGNGNYTGVSKLTNPVNDANDMTETLKGLGFTVEKVLDGDLERMEKAIIQFRDRLRASRDTYGFFYYAGHGVQASGENYLIPVNANTIQSESQLRLRAVSVQTMMDELNSSGNVLNMIVLDACRDNPFGWSRSGSRGLSVMSNAPVGSIVVYATSANSTAADGAGRNGLFTTQLLRNLKTQGLTIREVFDRTGMDVVQASNGVQHPEISVKYFDTAYLGEAPKGAVPPRTPPEPVHSAPVAVTPAPKPAAPAADTGPKPAASVAVTPAPAAKVQAPDNLLVGKWEAVLEHGGIEDTYLIAFNNGGICSITVSSYSKGSTLKQSVEGRYSFSNGMLVVEARFRDNTITHIRSIDWKAIANLSADSFAVVVPVSNAQGASRMRAVFWKQ